MDEDFTFDADDSVDLPQPEADAREQLALLIDPDGGAGLRALAQAALDKIAKDGGTFIANGVRFISGADNGCSVDRLVRVELDDHDAHRLAEPWPTAMVEAVLSLLRDWGG